MRDFFMDYAALMKSDFFRERFNKVFGKSDRVFQSRRVEDEIYKDVRNGRDERLNNLERQGKEKLPILPELSRDLFQSIFSLNVKENDESKLTPLARKFNRPIMKQFMDSSTYPLVKAICEGHELPAYAATEVFMEQICAHLDELMQAAEGSKTSMSTLNKETSSQERRIAELQNLIELRDISNQDHTLDKKILRMANRAHSKVQQLAALEKIVDQNILRSQEKINAILDAAGQSALQSADEIAQILLSWGNDPGNMRPDVLNRQLLQRVRRNDQLIKISHYLGRLREMLRIKRKNSTVYGRGEKYGIELGNRLRCVLSSEFALLATPETVPFFLRKYQRGALLQYQRRERICKGQGDKIVCLDESISTMEGDGSNAAWGKAVAYALLDAAGFHKRNFALIHFSDSGDFKTDLFRPGQFTPEDVLTSAENFLNGGTDFETPLREAIRLMDTGEFRKADIVFITDGECQISQDFTDNLKQKKAAMGFTITGILMDQANPGMKFTLTPFCDEIYRISDLGGESIAEKLLSARL